MNEKYSLVGVSGNAFSVMGYIESSMRDENKTESEIGDYKEEAMSGTYEELLCVSMDILDVLNENN